MITMLNEDGYTFKEIEENIFRTVCSWGQTYAKELLERYDEYLMKNRDIKTYRNKGLRTTTIKTIFGEVTYERRVYEVKREDGLKEFVYLLDEQLKIPGVGLISQNLADRIVSGITKMSYRECSRKVSEMTGQAISAMGVWKTIQALGAKVCEEEKRLVEAHKSGKVIGEAITPVLFEEADGVYINLQREKQSSREMKVGIAYDGWEESGKERYSLSKKIVVAGFLSTKEFRETKEAAIASKYNTDEIEIRLLNGDGAEWIKRSGEEDTIFQLDPFHRNKAIKENLPYREAREAVHNYLIKKDFDGMFEYLEVYKDSLYEDVEIKKAEKLINYFRNNEQGLLSYQEQGVRLPKPPEGLVYRNMGTMENHIGSVIADRMKHRHASWSIRGGNNLAKILAKKSSGLLEEVTKKLKLPLFDGNKIVQISEEILSAGAIKEKIGRGYKYPLSGHLPRLDNSCGITHRTLLGIAGY